MRSGRARTMGLGAYPAVSLAKAREEAAKARAIKAEGKDPIVERDALRVAQRLADAKVKTFDQCRDEYIALNQAGWKNIKHASQWRNTLTTYVTPVFGKLLVQEVDVALVLKALAPIWSTKPETAGRVRGRIESVLDYAAAIKLRTSENPARWRGNLKMLLPSRAKVRKVEHHAALPYSELPAFLDELRGQEGIAARALEFTILTIARTNETIGASWDEISVSEKLWTISAERMKAERDHRVPLSKLALEILDEMKPARDAGGNFVFPGGKAAQPLSNMAMLALVDRMNDRRSVAGQPRWTDPKQGNKDIVPHGFRSTFRDWAAERTNFPNEMVEMALAHAIDSKVEAAYRRGDLFDKRRRLMQAWSVYCQTEERVGGAVIPLIRPKAQ